jgi:hypothetical protein
MPCGYFQIEEDIQQAIESVSTEEKPNVAALARLYNIPRKRL